MSRVVEEVALGIILEDKVDRTASGKYKNNDHKIVVTKETRIGLKRDHFQEIMAVIELEVQAIVDQDQDSEPVPIGIE